MVSVQVNGREVSAQELQDGAASSVEDLDTVHVQSELTASLADRALSEVEEHLPTLAQVVRELAAVFQEGRIAEGLEGCQRVTEVWMEIVSRERWVAETMELDLDECEVDERSVNEHHAELNEFLQEVLRALKMNDYVLLGDLFEHELAPRLDTELRIVNELRTMMKTNFS